MSLSHDAIKALIVAIEDGGTGNISIAAWVARDSIRVPFGYSIKTVLSNVSVAIAFQNANLPNCEWQLHSDGYAYIIGPDGLIKASAHNYSPATALVVATLRAMQRQRTDLGNKDLKIERLTKENIERRRILRNALDGQAGWKVDARAELDMRGKK